MKENTDPTSRLIFIGGIPRSGTTLVQNIMDSHPDVYGGPEFDLMPIVANLFGAAHARVESGRLAEFLDHPRLDEVFRRFVLDLFLPVADREGCHYLSEKTPFNVRAFPFLLRTLPASKLVYVVRDPRAVLASNLEVARRYVMKGEARPDFLTDAGHCLSMMVGLSNLGWATLERAPERVHLVCYEDLVTMPDRTVQGLADFLGLSFDPAMLAPEAHDHAGASKASSLWNDHAMFKRSIDQESTQKWRETLSAPQLEAIERAFAEHPLYRAVGYDLRVEQSEPARVAS